MDLTTERKLAARVEEASIECLEPERDATLYYLLARHPGRTLVFVNAVSSTRRVAALLKLLGLPATALHAQQQQRQRLKVCVLECRRAAVRHGQCGLWAAVTALSNRNMSFHPNTLAYIYTLSLPHTATTTITCALTHPATTTTICRRWTASRSKSKACWWQLMWRPAAWTSKV